MRAQVYDSLVGILGKCLICFSPRLINALRMNLVGGICVQTHCVCSLYPPIDNLCCFVYLRPCNLGSSV